jgi:hypothetical protein
MNHHGPVIHPPAGAADRHSLLTTRHDYLNDVSTKVVQRPGNSAVDGRDDVRHPRRNPVYPTVIRHFRPPSPKGHSAPAQVRRHSNTQPARAVPAVRRRRVGASQADGQNERPRSPRRPSGRTLRPAPTVAAERRCRPNRHRPSPLPLRRPDASRWQSATTPTDATESARTLYDTVRQVTARRDRARLGPAAVMHRTAVPAQPWPTARSCP